MTQDEAQALLRRLRKIDNWIVVCAAIAAGAWSICLRVNKRAALGIAMLPFFPFIWTWQWLGWWPAVFVWFIVAIVLLVLTIDLKGRIQYWYQELKRVAGE
jgi:hypothetical protein